MIYCRHGNTTIWIQRIPYGISYCVDNKISPPYPTSWRPWVSTEGNFVCKAFLKK